MKQLGELFRDTWKLRPPAVLISVTGAADRDMSAQMTDKQQLVFRRGLNQAAKITKAWVITGGTNAGVMSMVGRTLSHADHNLPCIGIATWGVVAGHEQMEAAQSGRVLRYAELLRNAAHDRKEARQAAGQDSASAYGGSEAPAPAQTSLEPNHSHFVLVDDGTVGKFGSEIQVRAALEDAICRRLVGGGGGDASEQSAGTPGGVDTASGGSAQSRQNASISQQPEAVTYDAELHSGARALATPMVLLVLNGGKGTLETVLETLKKDRPVVVLEDSGGCAADISRCAVATPARAAQRSTCSTLLLWPFLRCGDATHARCRSRAVPHTPRGARLGLLPLPPLTLCPLPLPPSLSLTPSLSLPLSLPLPHTHTPTLFLVRVSGRLQLLPRGWRAADVRGRARGVLQGAEPGGRVQALRRRRKGAAARDKEARQPEDGRQSGANPHLLQDERRPGGQGQRPRPRHPRGDPERLRGHHGRGAARSSVGRAQHHPNSGERPPRRSQSWPVPSHTVSGPVATPAAIPAIRSPQSAVLQAHVAVFPPPPHDCRTRRLSPPPSSPLTPHPTPHARWRARPSRTQAGSRAPSRRRCSRRTPRLCAC